jgi:hypothetical protein
MLCLMIDQVKCRKVARFLAQAHNGVKEIDMENINRSADGLDWARKACGAVGPGSDAAELGQARESWDSSWDPLEVAGALARHRHGLSALAALAGLLLEDSSSERPASPDVAARWSAAVAGAAMAQDMGARLGQALAPLGRVQAGRSISTMAMAAGCDGSGFAEGDAVWVARALRASGKTRVDLENWLAFLARAPDGTCVPLLAAAAPAALAAWAREDLEGDVPQASRASRGRAL